MSYPSSIYPTWETPDDFDGPEDYEAACRNAEDAYDQHPYILPLYDGYEVVTITGTVIAWFLDADDAHEYSNSGGSCFVRPRIAS